MSNENPYGQQPDQQPESQPHEPQPYGWGTPTPPYGAGSAGAPVSAAKPDNNLVWAILSTILCCLPLGVVSIVFAAKVDSLWMAGRHAEAHDAAAKARTWAIASAVVSVVGAVVWMLLVLAGGMAAGGGEVTYNALGQ